MKNVIFTFIILVFQFHSFSQTNNSTAIIKGVVNDKETGEPIPFANLLLYNDSGLVSGASTDFDGKYAFDKLDSGEYRIEIKFIGYQPSVVKGIKAVNNRITIYNAKLSPSAMELESFEVVNYSIRRSSRFLRKSNKAHSNQDRGARNSSSYNYVDGVNVNSTGSETYDQIKEGQFKNVKTDALSTFSIDVDRASYSNIRRFITDGELPPKDAVRVEEMINYFSYDYPQPSTEHPFSISTEYTSCPWNKDHKLVHIGIQGQKIDLGEAPANNLVFLIDVSGSMSSPNKLGLLKKGLNLLIDNLRKEDRVAIVVYAGAAGLVLPSTSGKHKDKIRDVIDNLEAGGSTAGSQGIKLAYQVAKKQYLEKGNNRVVLATDGDFNVGISDEDKLVELIENKREENIFLSVLGFGTGNLQDSKMEKLADKGNGNYNYIDNILEAKKVLVTELGGTLVAIAKDVKVQAEFNPVHVKAYRLIGYENRQLNNEDFNDDKIDAGELGSGHTVTVLYEIIPANSKETVPNVDSLKYQSSSSRIVEESFPGEVLTVKFRYKKPKGSKSIRLSKVVLDKEVGFVNSSNNCQFAASVAGFGMLLRGSKYIGEYSYNNVIETAKNAKGEDDEGYRSEFIRLVKMAELLQEEL